MRTFHVSVFCEIKEPNLPMLHVMTLIEVTFVVNAVIEPPAIFISDILHSFAPELVPIAAEVNEVPHVDLPKRQ